VDVVVTEVTPERAVAIVTADKVVGWVVDLASTAGRAGWIFHTGKPRSSEESAGMYWVGGYWLHSEAFAFQPVVVSSPGVTVHPDTMGYDAESTGDCILAIFAIGVSPSETYVDPFAVVPIGPVWGVKLQPFTWVGADVA
tara:strand:+ start:95 stop:514 length:420 start_codon:yes stop_codon:yes gene_type:complete